ncbi:MAG: penicillin acylase family protein [Gammaproteobacteria bacterium]|nr:penicillin acylase family protein [Gammaproteobacteria bacterium]
MKKTNKRRLFSTKKQSSFRRWIRRIVYLMLSLLIVVTGSIYLVLNGSLPTYSGELELSGLSEPVTISRDAFGTADITANTRSDLAFALGFTHAQERFFQMDLLRKSAAGELSELIGSATINIDKRVRQHRFRARSEEIVKNLPQSQLNLLTDYTEGVNAGLEQLSTSPFEYWLLNTEPQKWRIEDSILVVYAMYLDLQPSSIERERILAEAFLQLPSDVYQQLVPNGTRFDAPLDNSELNSVEVKNFIKPNSSETLISDSKPVNNENYQSSDLDEKTDSESKQNNVSDDNDADTFPGSNNFAVSGQKSNTGSSIVAGDMHLGHAVPNIWFKANLNYKTDSQSDEINLYGVTLPGTPLLIAGTNNHIAWAFTNSYGDYSDVIKVEISAVNSKQYVYQNETYDFEYYQEVIRVKGQQPETIDVIETMFGPVLEKDESSAFSLMWIAHQPEAINLNLMNLEQSNTVASAMNIANQTAIPAQNFVVGDQSGNIGWTIIGPLPKRLDTQQTVPVTTIAHQSGKIQWLDADQYPRITNPDSESIWTANNRIVGGNDLQKIGDGGFANGVRAFSIKKQLQALSKADEESLLDIQLSTDAPLYKPWQTHMLSLLKNGNKLTDRHRQVKDVLQSWNGRSDKDQAAFTVMKKYRYELASKLLDPLAEKLSPNAKSGLRYYSRQYEALLWELIQKQPQDYLPQQYSSYKALFETTLNDILSELTTENQVIADQLWGNYNRLKIQHPISRAVPVLGYWLDRPNIGMPGDVSSPRVQTASFGASQRFVISPGHIESAIFHMPGGQSGHPFSEFYDIGFEDWVKGRPTPLATQEIRYTLRLNPKQ